MTRLVDDLLIFELPLFECLHGLYEKVSSENRSVLHEFIATLLNEVLLDDMSLCQILVP